MDESFYGVAYRAEFDTSPGRWLEVELPFEALQASYGGSVLHDVEPPDLARIRQVGFLIADQTEGAFSLEIAWLKAYASAP